MSVSRDSAVAYISHDGTPASLGMASLIARRLEKCDVRTNNGEVSAQRSFDSRSLVLVLITRKFIEDLEQKDSKASQEFADLQLTGQNYTVLPVVIDDQCRSPTTWNAARRLGDMFYVDYIPQADGREDLSKTPHLLEKARLFSKVTTSTYFITMHGDPNWRSHVQEGSPYLQEGFSNTRSSCGAGGEFVAYNAPTKSADELTLGAVKCWVHPEKTHTDMLEWRVFAAGNKFMVTSNRRDTAPGWSLQKLFYAHGRPSLGCDQGQTAHGDAATTRFHVFNSHNWSNGNHARVMTIHNYIASRGIISWCDEHQLKDTQNIVEQLQKGLDMSACVVVYITRDYIDKCSGTEDLDNCKREFVHYLLLIKQKKIQCIVVVIDQQLRDPAQWGALACLASERRVVLDPDQLCPEAMEPLAQSVCSLLGITPALYYISMVEWKSYVNKGSLFTDNGFKATGSCGAGGVFEAFDKPAPGLVKVEVEGATFYVSNDKASLQQLEWRCYRAGDKTLVTSNRRDMAPGWTFLTSFYARGRPSNGCDQVATI